MKSRSLVVATVFGIAAIFAIFFGGTHKPTPEELVQTSKSVAGSQCREAIKTQLRDPDSVVYEATTVEPIEGKQGWKVTVSYRAKNGFGGYNREIAACAVDWYGKVYGGAVKL